MTSQEKNIKRYLECLETTDLAKTLKLFTKNADVQGTLYNTKKAPQFFKDFFNDTSSSKTTLKSLSPISPDIIKVIAEYIWTLKEGQIVTYHVISFFHFNKKNKVEKLVITRDIISLS